MVQVTPRGALLRRWKQSCETLAIVPLPCSEAASLAGGEGGAAAAPADDGTDNVILSLLNPDDLSTAQHYV